MKSLLFTIMFSLCVLATFAQSPAIFTEPHFSGQSQTLRAGNYRTADLRVGDKTISSIKLPDGFKAIVFDADNFEGDFFEITVSIPSLDFWSDRISSIKIIDLNNPNANNEVSVNSNNNSTNNNNNSTNNSNNPNNQPVIRYGANDIVIFSDINFSGEAQILVENGRYDDTQISIGNDQMRSAKVPQGYTVRLFDAGGFDGRVLDLTSDTPDLARQRFDGQVSSIQVFRGNAPSLQNTGNAVTLYLGSKYKWRNQSLGEGNYTSKDFGLAYDLTAMRVSQGFYVKLFDRDNFQGSSVEVSNDVSDLDDIGWNDRAVSLQVIRGFPSNSQQLNNNNNNWGSTTNNNTNSNNSNWVNGTNNSNGNNWNNNNSNWNNNTANQVIIYQNWDFGGRMQALNEGNYANMSNLTVRNYDVSSIRIPQGFGVRLFSRENGQGSFVDLNQDVSNLSSIGWDNRAMSLQVYRLQNNNNNNWNSNSNNGLPNSNTGLYSNLNRSYRMSQGNTNYRIRISNNGNASQIQTQSGFNDWTNVQVISADNQRGYYRIRDNGGNEFDINLQSRGTSLTLSNRSNTWTYFAE